MRIFLKNTAGKPSASLTMMIITFSIVISWLVFWIIGRSFGLPVPEFDATSASALLAPIMTLYFGRRYTSQSDTQNKTLNIEIEGSSKEEK